MNLIKLKKILDSAKPKDLARMHHTLMQFYHCWIPIEEFKKTPIPTLVNLLQFINEDVMKLEREKFPRVPKRLSRG